ncbi:MAG: hypothetical protein E6G68_05025 [Actinobacteria bacterium]|nr:MAG: hypothetical protein E6G68_05025 [Actinomycetota bacterium]
MVNIPGMRSTRLLIAAAATVLSVIAWSPARAQLPAIPSFLCTAHGTVDVSVNASTGVATWTVSGTGDCTELFNPVPMCSDRYGDPCSDPGPKPPFTFSGSGTSQGAGGLCGGLLVKHLTIATTLHVPSFWSDPFFGDSGWGVYEFKQRWVKPKTTFPGVTPFRILAANTDRTMGAGVIVDSEVNKCPSQWGHSKARFELLFG